MLQLSGQHISIIKTACKLLRETVQKKKKKNKKKKTELRDVVVDVGRDFQCIKPLALFHQTLVALTLTVPLRDRNVYVYEMKFTNRTLLYDLLTSLSQLETLEIRRSNTQEDEDNSSDEDGEEEEERHKTRKDKKLDLPFFSMDRLLHLTLYQAGTCVKFIRTPNLRSLIGVGSGCALHVIHALSACHSLEVLQWTTPPSSTRSQFLEDDINNSGFNQHLHVAIVETNVLSRLRVLRLPTDGSFQLHLKTLFVVPLSCPKLAVLQTQVDTRIDALVVRRLLSTGSASQTFTDLRLLDPPPPCPLQLPPVSFSSRSLLLPNKKKDDTEEEEQQEEEVKDGKKKKEDNVNTKNKKEEEEKKEEEKFPLQQQLTVSRLRVAEFNMSLEEWWKLLQHIQMPALEYVQVSVHSQSHRKFANDVWARLPSIHTVRLLGHPLFLVQTYLEKILPPTIRNLWIPLQTTLSQPETQRIALRLAGRFHQLVRLCLKCRESETHVVKPVTLDVPKRRHPLLLLTTESPFPFE